MAKNNDSLVEIVCEKVASMGNIAESSIYITKDGLKKRMEGGKIPYYIRHCNDAHTYFVPIAVVIENGWADPKILRTRNTESLANIEPYYTKGYLAAAKARKAEIIMRPKPKQSSSASQPHT